MTVTPPPLSELEHYLGDLAREMLGPDVSPLEIRAFVVGQTAGLMRAHYPSDTPQQLRRRVVHGAGFLRARRIAEVATSNAQLDPGQA